MQIRFQEKFKVSKYNLEVVSEGLLFSSRNGASLMVPFADIRHFSVDGKGQSIKRFVMETTENVYEGSFLNEGDADILVQKLRERPNYYVDIRLDAE